MKKSSVFIAVLMLSAFQNFAQPTVDTAKAKELKEVIIRAWQRRELLRLQEEGNGFLHNGKKNEVINIAGTNANIALKTGRQLFSRIPGVFVYDMDGSGNQLNISTRGLDPHRSWEFNVRQNGVIINSDMYGYPASHYSAPLESIEKIELVRGTGSLQYGAQFGGMMNYVTKRPDTSKAFTFESVNSVGSFNVLSSYNAISGTHKKFSYYAYYYCRHADDYRDNGRSDGTAQFVQLQYQFNPQFAVTASLGRSKYLYKIPGPLNDSMLQADPRMSTRDRNFYSPDIYVPSVMLNWKLSDRTKINLLASGVFGDRSSVMLDAFATVPDTIDRATGQYKNRQVDIDNFNSKTVELRILHQYHIGSLESKLATGLVYMNNDLHRRQQGKGTTGTDYDLTVINNFGRDIHFKTNNIAVFAENIFRINPHWTISPGIRFENGDSKMSGRISYYTVNPLPTTIRHRFVLIGISSQYQLNNDNTLYGGISQAYRPVIFKDVVPASTYEQIDKDLKNGFGYNAEAGIRGKLWKQLQYDVNFFRLQYQNRLGSLVLQDGQGQPYIYRTNTGNTVTNGVEIFLQYKFPVTHDLYVGLFTSTSLMDGKYTSGELSAGTSNKSIAGNRIEAVPRVINRNGLDVLYRAFSCSILYNYTSSTFSDALNTGLPPATGARGFTPSYAVWDVNASARICSNITIRAGVNNILDKQYFTKRPTMYPGPGIWPSDGRSVYLTVGVKI